MHAELSTVGLSRCLYVSLLIFFAMNELPFYSPVFVLEPPCLNVFLFRKTFFEVVVGNFRRILGKGKANERKRKKTKLRKRTLCLVIKALQFRASN